MNLPGLSIDRYTERTNQFARHSIKTALCVAGGCFFINENNRSIVLFI